MLNKCEPKVVALWHYDLFPYMLGAKGSFTDFGDFYANSYGSTFSRKSIVAVYTLERGEEVLKELKQLESDYLAEIKAVNLSFEGKVKKLVPELNKS
jgi:hypothetical protein